jgi:homoserine O-acetyltransferase
MLTYRAEPGLERRQSRHASPKPGSPGQYRIQGYLEHVGVSLRARFTTKSYLALLDAMDSHDVSQDLQHVTAQTLVVDIDSDVLFTSHQSDRLAELIPRSERATLRSEHGHDAFLMEWEQMTSVLGRVLATEMLPEVNAPWAEVRP